MVEADATLYEQERGCVRPNPIEEHAGFCTGEYQRNSIAMFG
jgi:hypothetical protein